MTTPTTPTASTSPPSQPLAPPPEPPRRGPGFFSRLVSALMVVLITTLISFAAVVLAYFWLGFSLDTPARVDQGRQRLDDQEAILADLQARNALLQTQVADMDAQSSQSAATLAELRTEIEEFNRVRQRLTEQLEAGARENATLVAEMRASRDTVLLFATAEADRAALLRDLKLRSDRIERFLQRLSDIAEDTALDLNQGNPADMTPTPAPTLTLTPTLEPTLEPTATPEVLPTPTLTPTRSP